MENLSVEYLQENFSGATQFFKQLAQGDVQQHEDRIRLRDLLELGFRGPFAVSDDTFHMEYHFKLFRWKLGETEWYDTGQEETVELTLDIARKDLKLAGSGNTIYSILKNNVPCLGGVECRPFPTLSSSLSFKDSLFLELSNHFALSCVIIIPFLNDSIALAVFKECPVMLNKLGSLFYLKTDLLTEMV